MPMMVADGFIEPAQFIHYVANVPTSGDLALANAVSQGVANAALSGLFTCTVSVAAYNNTLVQLLMQRLTNMGYTSSLSTNTLTVNW